MHRSKLFSTLFCKLPTVLFCSLLTITALTTISQLTGQNTAVAQSNTKPTVKNVLEKKCTDKDVLALYKAVGDLNTLFDVGINYTDFNQYYLELKILQNTVGSLNTCSETVKILSNIVDNYQIVRILWNYRINGGDFVPVNHSFVTRLGTVADGLKRFTLHNGDYVAAKHLESLYMQEILKTFENVNIR